MNKEIRKLKLTVTTGCNLRCPYCFVKLKRQVMPQAIAKKSVDLLLKSKGSEKLLSIYGGEPFMVFPLVEHTVSYAQSQAIKMHKKLTVSICTNLTLISRKHLEFIKSYGIKLVGSLAGKKALHDKERVFPGYKGTYNTVTDKLNIITGIIPPANLGGSLCVFSSKASNLADNFQHLLSLSFTNINLEIIRQYGEWGPESIRELDSGLHKIISYILSGIRKKRFIYLNPLNWELKYGMLTRAFRADCPFHFKLEVYPKGDMAFSPFLLNLPNKKDFIIGNIAKRGLRKFRGCSFDSGTQACKGCENNYFKSGNIDRSASVAYSLYQLHCLRSARQIQEFSKFNKSFRDYAHLAKERACF